MIESALAEWQSFFDGADTPPQMRPVILESWERCRRVGLPRATSEPLFRRVPADELARRMAATAALRAAAAPHLAWTSACFSDIHHAVYITDADGIVVASTGRWPGGLEALGLDPGCDWSEATMGTNGAGTAIAADQPIAVIGEEHYSVAFQRCTCTGAPLHGPDGRVIGAIDLSTFAEDAKPGQLLLISYVAYVIDQTLKAKAEIEDAESMKLLAHLSSFTAHELVSPLSAVSNAAVLLRRLPMPREAEKALGVLERGSRGLKQAVQDLRILGGAHSDGTFAALDVVALARAVLVEIQAPDVRVVLEASRPVLEVGCHEGLLSRALRNLVRNACDAMPSGGIVEVRVEPAPGGVCITVSDDGPGIPPEKREVLFSEAFTTKPHGSGLGLLLTKAIIERVHGGRLSYRENAPRGSCFEIWLPG